MRVADRTWALTIRAKHTAITWKREDILFAMRAACEGEACICRHLEFACFSAMRTYHTEDIFK